jgi:hypothetical protein
MSINSRAYIISAPHVDYQEELRKVQQFNVVVSFVEDTSSFTEMLAKVQQTIVVLRMLAKPSP